MQTVRKLAICAKTVDQIADFGVKLNFERSEASIFEAEVEAPAGPCEFSHSLHEHCDKEFLRKRGGF